MPQTLSRHNKAVALNESIRNINSLGGPSIPMGMDRAGIQVTLENFAAQDTAVYQLRVADLFVRRNT